MQKSLLLVCAFLALLSQNCGHSSAKSPENPAALAAQKTPGHAAQGTAPDNFGAYWYQGKAELCTYDVQQDRYGEPRRAQQVNVFVTEDLSRQKQVKLDDPAAAAGDRAPVLKLNAIRRFKTGIYDYSIMQSVFTPLDGGPTLKSTCSVQDWCGQVFLQTNATPEGYRFRGYSYFEREGDQEAPLPAALLEDELWLRLRINPGALPTGQQQIIPSAVHSRIQHRAYSAQTADLQIDRGEKESTLQLRYSSIPRSLSIRFETAFPHRILGWEEQDGGKTSSKGSLLATRLEAYWSKNSNKFAPLRDSLRLVF